MEQGCIGYVKLLIATMLVSYSAMTPAVLHAEKPSVKSAVVENKPNILNVSVTDGRVTIEATEVPLGDLLKAVTEKTKVEFIISQEELKSDPVTVKVENKPSEEAIKLLLVGYNTLHVWDEKMTLLQINVFGRSDGTESKPIAGTEKSVLAKGGKPGVDRSKHPRSETIPDKKKIESALKDIHSENPDQRQAALDGLVGGDDARIAPAMLELALNQSNTTNSDGKDSAASNSGNDEVPFRAAMSLWRHGLERGFADSETIEALRTLQERGTPATSNIAKQALEDMQSNFPQ